jgi:ribosome-associated translation inhibitor RaiA
MNVQVETDSNVHGSEALKERATIMIESALQHHGDQITRVEVHLADENSRAKSGKRDKRCVIEARPAGLPPVAARHTADTVEAALTGAIEKLQRVLERSLGRLNDKRSGT